MKGSRRVPRFLAMLVSATIPALAATAAMSPEARIHAGDPVVVGNGQARVLVVENTRGTPTSVHVVLDGAALEGLPPATAEHERWEYLLPMPASGPVTGYDHVGLDWNPAGHIPEGIYSRPHFDVHFYLIGTSEQHAITFRGPNRERALAAPDASLVPAGYVVPPDTAQDSMGLHGLDPAGPEFRGQAFTHTFIYGYHEGRLIFVEPMVTREHLRGRGDVTVAVRTPAAYSMPGYYPTRYRIGYDAQLDRHHVVLLGLRPHRVPVASRR